MNVEQTVSFLSVFLQEKYFRVVFVCRTHDLQRVKFSIKDLFY